LQHALATGGKCYIREVLHWRTFLQPSVLVRGMQTLLQLISIPAYALWQLNPISNLITKSLRTNTTCPDHRKATKTRIGPRDIHCRSRSRLHYPPWAHILLPQPQNRGLRLLLSNQEPSPFQQIAVSSSNSSFFSLRDPLNLEESAT
jgi:hypothetical protein